MKRARLRKRGEGRFTLTSHGTQRRVFLERVIQNVKFFFLLLPNLVKKKSFFDIKICTFMSDRVLSSPLIRMWPASCGNRERERNKDEWKMISSCTDAQSLFRCILFPYRTFLQNIISRSHLLPFLPSSWSTFALILLKVIFCCPKTSKIRKVYLLVYLIHSSFSSLWVTPLLYFSAMTPDREGKEQFEKRFRREGWRTEAECISPSKFSSLALK